MKLQMLYLGQKNLYCQINLELLYIMLVRCSHSPTNIYILHALGLTILNKIWLENHLKKKIWAQWEQ